MERRLQEVLEEDGGVRSDDRGRDSDASSLVQKRGPDSLHGCGEHNADGEGVLEEIDLSEFSPRLKARFEKMNEEEARLTREQKDALVALLPEGQVSLDADFGKKTSFGAGGMADAIATVNGIEELKKVLTFAVERNCEYTFFGTGTKTLVRDGGFGGIVIALGEGFSELTAEESGEEVVVTAASKVLVRDLLSLCSEKGYSGAEWLASFGGTIGGSLVSGVSKISNSLGEIVEEITVAMKDGRELTLKGKGLKSDESKLRVPRTAATTKVVLKLKKSTVEDVAANIANEMKNVSTDDCAGAIRNVFENIGKVRAVECVEDAGLNGVRVGGARVSRTDANCIVNEGNAKAKDISVLMEMIKDRVKQSQGVQLEPAINIIGERRR